MKRPISKTIVVLALAILTTAELMTRVVLGQTKAVALLTQPEGDVRVRKYRRPHEQRIREDMLLNLGDGINVNGNGTAVVYQAYAPVTRLNANGRFIVRRRTPPPVENALTPAEFTSLKLNYLSARQNRNKPSPATMGGPEVGILTLLEPRNSSVLVLRPHFKWSQVSNATKYILSIYKADESLICTETTAKTELGLPSSCGPLNPGDYKWDVTAQVGNQTSDNSALYDATSFTVVSEEREQEISKAVRHASTISRNNRDAILVLVTILLEHKLYPRAEAELLDALGRAPANQSLWTLLIETYGRMKRWRTRERARELSAGKPSAELIHTLKIRKQ
jgi:hypothetical protein